MILWNMLLPFLTLINQITTHGLSGYDIGQGNGILFSAFELKPEFRPNMSKYENFTIFAGFPEMTFRVAHNLSLGKFPDFQKFFKTKLSNSFIHPNDVAVFFQFGNEADSPGIIFELSHKLRTQESSYQDIDTAVLGGIVGVTFTNVCSILGIICVPIKKWKHYALFLTFFVALAVSVLSSTSLLVLLPEALHLHVHGEDAELLSPSAIKLMAIFFGIFFFYILDYIVMQVPYFFKQEKKLSVSENTEEILLHTKVLNIFDTSSNAPEQPRQSWWGRYEHVGRIAERLARITPKGWMIMIGDSIHNIVYGLVIGAGFARATPIGIMLSISILLAELPHEFSDFPVLLLSGFSVTGALIGKLLSSSTAYIGLLIGYMIGNMPSGAAFVFSVTAGFFLYISLSNMIPELRKEIENTNLKNKQSCGVFAMQLFGLEFGFLCIIGVILMEGYIVT